MSEKNFGGYELSKVLGVLLFFIVLGVLIFAFAPGQWTPAWIVNHDKFSHMVVFFSLGVMVNFTFTKVKLYLQLIFLIMLALLIELLQYSLFNRGFSYMDIVFDLLGIVLFLILNFVMKNKKLYTLAN
jgi:VanZ family protein